MITDYNDKGFQVAIDMRTIKTTIINEIEVKNIAGYFEHTVTKFSTSAKIDCPKEYSEPRKFFGLGSLCLARCQRT